MPRQVAAIISDAALRPMHERHGPFETGRGEDGAQRLAGLRRIHHQGLPREVLFTIFDGLRPFDDPLDFVIRDPIFEVLFLIGQHFPVFGLTKQVEMIEYVICVLGHDEDPYPILDAASWVRKRRK